jgi:hypothetical protein
MRRNVFLYCYLPIAATSTFGFQIDESEKDFLRADWMPVFSHSLDPLLTFGVSKSWHERNSHLLC